MESILNLLKRGKILIADGAMGSMLIQRGLKPGACPEWLNIENPEIPQEISRLYFQAGADIIQTNTFGGSPLKLAEYRLDDQTEKINRQGAAIVRNVVGDNAFVSGSCGPTGKFLKPYGDTEVEELYNGFKRQIEALIEAGVDLVCIETMSDLQEAVTAVKTAKEIVGQKAGRQSVAVAATMTFDMTSKGFYTMMGVTVSDAAAGLQQAGADIIGSNCGNGVENMILIARELRSVTDLPLLIQPNAGKPEERDGEIVYSESPEFFAEQVTFLIDAGVSIVGGCCGTTPEHIRGMKAQVTA